MSFVQDDEPVLIVMAGDAKVNNKKYKTRFRQKAVMIPGNIYDVELFILNF